MPFDPYKTRLRNRANWVWKNKVKRCANGFLLLFRFLFLNWQCNVFILRKLCWCCVIYIYICVDFIHFHLGISCGIWNRRLPLVRFVSIHVYIVGAKQWNNRICARDYSIRQSLDGKPVISMDLCSACVCFDSNRLIWRQHEEQVADGWRICLWVNCVGVGFG